MENDSAALHRLIILNCKTKETDMQLTLTQVKLEKKITCYQSSKIGITECYVYQIVRV